MPQGGFREAIAKVKALPVQPDFVIHTGDVSQLSRPEEFDDAEQMLKELGRPVFFVPGEHDMLDEGQGKAYLARYGKGTKGAGWYSFDASGVHFIGLVNVVDLKAGGLGNLGNEQLEWLEDDLQGRSASTPASEPIRSSAPAARTSWSSAAMGTRSRSTRWRRLPPSTTSPRRRGGWYGEGRTADWPARRAAGGSGR